MSLKFFKSEGSLPDNLCPRKSKTLSLAILPQLVGIVPDNPFFPNNEGLSGSFAISKCIISERFPRLDGKFPDNLLSDKDIRFSRTKLPKLVGIEPNKSLSLKLKTSKRERFPNSLGIKPVKLLRFKRNCVNSVNLPISEGIVPVIALPTELPCKDNPNTRSFSTFIPRQVLISPPQVLKG